MRYLTTITLCLLGLLAVSTSAFAQDAQGSDESAIKLSESGLELPKPDGWVQKEGGKGVVVRMQAAGEAGSYIDFRMAPDVDAKKAQTFFTSFHASLQSAGLKKVRTTESKTYGEHAGDETEYEAKGADGSFNLIIWQIHVGKRAWMVVGYFNNDVRETLYRDFQTIIGTVVFLRN